MSAAKAAALQRRSPTRGFCRDLSLNRPDPLLQVQTRRDMARRNDAPILLEIPYSRTS